MSKNKNKPKPPQPLAQQAPAPPAPTQAPPQQALASSAPPASTQLAISKWTIIIGIVGPLISSLALLVSWKSYNNSNRATEISEKTQDRASGKIRAHFTYVDLDNDRDNKSLRPFIKKEVGKDEECFRLDTADDLLRWAPSISIKNIGDEIIDSVRVDVRFWWGRAYGFGVKQKRPLPIVANGTTSRELSSFGKLMPNKKMTITLSPLLLEQMLESRSDFNLYLDKDREDNFNIDVFCRIVGATAYDAIEPQETIQINYHWRQTGFTDEKRNKAIIKMQPTIKIE